MPTAENKNRPPNHKVDQITRAATHSGQAKRVFHRPKERKKKRKEPLHRQRPNVVVGVRDLACAGLGGEGYILYACTSCNSSGIKSGRCSCAAECRRLFWDGVWCVWCQRVQNATISASLRMNKTARHTPASLPKVSTLITKAIKCLCQPLSSELRTKCACSMQTVLPMPKRHWVL
jgi:hypothetical protein